MTDEDKMMWVVLKKKTLMITLWCSLFEVLSAISTVIWVIYNALNQIPFSLMVIPTIITIAYVAFIPRMVKNYKKKTVEYIKIFFMLFGTYMFYSLILTSGFTLVNTPLLIIYFWCVASADSYGCFGKYYYKWKDLDDLLMIEVLQNDLRDINSKLFYMDSEKDEDKIKLYKDFIQFAEENIKYLKDKHGL